jgi:hypothetical protein
MFINNLTNTIMEKHVLEGKLFNPWSHSDRVEVGDTILREWLDTLPNNVNIRITVEVIDTPEDELYKEYQDRLMEVNSEFVERLRNCVSLSQ